MSGNDALKNTLMPGIDRYALSSTGTQSFTGNGGLATPGLANLPSARPGMEPFFTGAGAGVQLHSNSGMTTTTIYATPQGGSIGVQFKL